MTPEQCQKTIIGQLEDLTCKKLLLVDAESLSTHATLQMAKAADPAHVFRYRGNMKQHLPYLVASQCGLVTRVLHAKPELRFELSSTPSLPEEFQKLARVRMQKIGKSLPENSLVELSAIFQRALGVQLRSIPVTLRVEASIAQEFPSLKDMQRACTLQQLNEGMATLAPNVRQNIPDEIFDPSAGMNAAMAGYWSNVFGDEGLIVGYKATGFWETGFKLLDHFNRIPSDPDHDRELVQSWIETLDLQHWYYLTDKQQH